MVIHRLSFGNFIPGIQNPLDKHEMVADRRMNRDWIVTSSLPKLLLAGCSYRVHEQHRRGCLKPVLCEWSPAQCGDVRLWSDQLASRYLLHLWHYAIHAHYHRENHVLHSLLSAYLCSDWWSCCCRRLCCFSCRLPNLWTQSCIIVLRFKILNGECVCLQTI